MHWLKLQSNRTNENKRQVDDIKSPGDFYKSSVVCCVFAIVYHFVTEPHRKKKNRKLFLNAAQLNDYNKVSFLCLTGTKNVERAFHFESKCVE